VQVLNKERLEEVCGLCVRQSRCRAGDGETQRTGGTGRQTSPAATSESATRSKYLLQAKIVRRLSHVSFGQNLINVPSGVSIQGKTELSLTERAQLRGDRPRDSTVVGGVHNNQYYRPAHSVAPEIPASCSSS
jgi:hypothetical protein